MAQARFPAARDQLVGLDRDGNAIMRIKPAARQLDGHLAHRCLNHFGSFRHGFGSLSAGI